ncbi:MAG: type II toxin-antitoxin system HicB family antitoxin [Thermoguttaceae bacterium]
MHGPRAGCISEGDTLEEARENIREAIALYLESAEGPEVPEGGIVEQIAV